MSSSSWTGMKQAAPEDTRLVETTARLVASTYERESDLKELNLPDPKYSFLWRSDPCHAFYQQKVSEYRKEEAQNKSDGYIPPSPPPDDDDDDDDDLEQHLGVRWERSFTVPPEGVTLKELGIIKLTALFVARYAVTFLDALKKRVVMKPQFDFLKRSAGGGTRLRLYYALVDAYSKVIRPYIRFTTITDQAEERLVRNFFNRLQLEKLEEGDEMAMIDLHVFLSGVDSFAHMDDTLSLGVLPKPDCLSMMMKRWTEMRPPSSSTLTTEPALLPDLNLDELKHLGIIKLTAQFVARYGNAFRLDLMDRVVTNPLFRFLFLKPSHCRRSKIFSLLVPAYTRVLLPSESVGKAGPLLDEFSYRLQLFKLEDGVDMATIDLHGLVFGVDCFARMDRRPISLPPPEPLSMILNRLGSHLTRYLKDLDKYLEDTLADEDGSRSWDPASGWLFRFPANGVTLKDLGIIMLTAQFMARCDSHFESGLRSKVVMNRQFQFLNSPDRRFPLYSGLFGAYTQVFRSCLERSDARTAALLECFFNLLQSQKLEEDKGSVVATISLHAFVGVVDCFARLDNLEEYSAIMPPRGTIQPALNPPGTIVLPPVRSRATHDCVGDEPFPPIADSPPRPRKIAFTFPDGLTLQELCIIKVTAQFVARYGIDFELALGSRFEFMEPADSKFNFYDGIVDAYTRVLLPSEMMKKCEACQDTLLQGFFSFLDRLREEADKATIGLHTFVGLVDCFAHMEDEKYSAIMPPPEQLSAVMDPLTVIHPGMLVQPSPGSQVHS